MIDRPGSNATTGVGISSSAHPAGHRLRDAAGEVADRRGVVDGRVGDAEAATEVELGNVASGEEVAVHREQPGGGLDEPVGSEDLRADVAVEAEEAQAGVRADARHGVGRVAEGDAELLVLVGRGQERVRVGVDTAVHAEPHALHATVPLGGLGHAIDLLEAVDDDRADADGDGAVDLGGRLVVAVEAEPLGVDAGRQRHGELAAGADVDVQAGLGHPARDLDGEERLARVVDLGGGADLGEGGLQGVAHLGGALPRLPLVDDVERGAEAGGQVGRAHASDGDLTVVAHDRAGPETGDERVGIVRNMQPRGCEGIRSHRENLTGTTSGSLSGERTRIGP